MTVPVSTDRLCAALAAVRTVKPRVHCITNSVAQTYSANALLALGAIPAMTIAPDEVAGFGEKADALLINLGTFDSVRRSAVDVVLPIIESRSRPWALDPAHAESSPNRAELARELLARKPAVLRCNAVEFEILTGDTANELTVRAAAMEFDTVVAVTGAVDIVADGERLLRIANGHELQSRVTAAGCAATALVAAFLATDADAFTATASALTTVGVAAEIAGRDARGPGSLQIGFLDELYRLTPEVLEQHARLS